MAFPYTSEENFELGTLGDFDTETDTESRLDFPHYSTLAALPTTDFGPAAPYQGAYCVRVNLENDGTPADAYLQETGAWDLAADGTIFFKFAFYLSPNTIMANNDVFAILQLWSATNTVEGGVYIKYTTASGFQVGIGETAPTQLKGLVLGRWHIMEVSFNIDAGGGNDGTIDAFLDGAAYTQVTALDQGVITSGVFGVVGQDAGTTKGMLLLDNIVSDDARLGYVPDVRFAPNRTFTKSGHFFVGPGCIDNAALFSGTGTTMTLYDTDEAETTSAQSFVVQLNGDVFAQVEGPVQFQRGCYVLLGGTNARGQVSIMHASDGRRGMIGPIYYGETGVRTWGLARTPRRA